MSETYDPHRSTSVALTEVRTVLNRARHALGHIGNPGLLQDYYPASYTHRGGDLDDIRTALEQAVELLKPWERHTRRETP